MEQLLVSSAARPSAKAPAHRFRNPFSRCSVVVGMGAKSLKLVCLHAKITRRRYMCPPHAASAARATHDKLTAKSLLCNGLRALATRFSFGLSPAGNGSNVLKRGVFLGLSSLTPARDILPFAASSPHSWCRSDRCRRPRRACGKASSGRFSAGVRPRTSVRDNARSRTG